MVGRVVSVKMTKTAIVLVESKKTHPLYGKSYKWTKRYLVDDQIGVVLGDIVIFEKIRPVSKHKHWQISKVLGKDIISLEQAELQEEAAEAIAEVMPEEKGEEEENAESSGTEETLTQAEVSTKKISEADKSNEKVQPKSTKETKTQKAKGETPKRKFKT